MTALSLANLIAWSVQVALVVGAGLAALWLVRLEAPAVRYLFLRGLLALTLALPLIQPRLPLPGALDRPISPATAVDMSPSRSTAAPSHVTAASSLSAPTTVVAIIAGGALLRLLWIAAGILRLRRLRRAGEVAAPAQAHDDLQHTITRRATIRYVPGLGQPVTFGFRSPVILLPAAVRDMPEAIERAVLAHELWHVRRADWLSTLCEESLRAVLWFHPVVGALISRIQSAREEVVDELAILTTGSRRTYVNALLTFSEAPSSIAAPAFARRRHLVRRLVVISKEVVMSGRRVVVSGAAVGAIVLSAAWYSVQAFPLRDQQPAVDRLTAVAGPIEARARAITAQNPVPRRTYSVPAAEPAVMPAGSRGTVTVRLVLDEAGQIAEQRITGVTLRQTDGFVVNVQVPTGGTLERMSRGTYRGTAGDETVSMQKAAQVVEAMMDSALRAVKQWQYAPPADGPIAFDVVLRFGAPPPPPPPPPATRASERPMPPPPPAAPPATSPRPGLMPLPPPPGQVSADAADPALRVGGDIQAPMKRRNVSPVYPQDAQDARVQGVVIIEARIERDGTVSRARVLRSIPMLDQAAVEAVQQWEFTPTLVNGAAVPVIMTVTVNFTLQ
jgi:TonB family protein